MPWPNRNDLRRKAGTNASMNCSWVWANTLWVPCPSHAKHRAHWPLRHLEGPRKAQLSLQDNGFDVRMSSVYIVLIVPITSDQVEHILAWTNIKYSHIYCKWFLHVSTYVFKYISHIQIHDVHKDFRIHKLNMSSYSFPLSETTIGQINDMTYYSVGVCLYQCCSDLLGQILSICVLALSLLLLLLRPVLLEPGLQVVTGPAKRPSNHLMVLSLLLTIARIAALRTETMTLQA